MGHYGNTSVEIVEQVEILQDKLGDQDYSAVHTVGNGCLAVDLHLRAWEGKTGWLLAWRCVRLVWVVFRKSLRSEWVRGQ